MSCQATEITAAGPTRDPLNLLRQMPDAVKNAHLTPPDMIGGLASSPGQVDEQTRLFSLSRHRQFPARGVGHYERLLAKQRG